MKNRFLLVFAVAAVAAQSLSAWDKPTHSVVAVIAFRELEQTNPAVAARVAEILKQSDDYSSFNQWSATIARTTLPASSAKEAEMLFILGARWPDDIKADGSGRDRSPHQTHAWHYINLPIGPKAADHAAKPPNIETEMVALQTQWGETKTDKERAPLLCWYLHLIGDSHQPLHSSNFFSADFPNGDAGGEDWAIHKEANASKLHGYWDNVLMTGEDGAATAKDVDALASDVRANYPRANFPQLEQNKDLAAWMKNETLPLALHYGYLDGKLTPPVPGTPTRLSDDYKKNALEISRQQVALAGYRLADLLAVLLGK